MGVDVTPVMDAAARQPVSPFYLATPCLLKVQAQTVEGELHGPALMVESAREG